MKKIESRQADVLYETLRKYLLSKEDIPTYRYQKKVHHLYEDDASPATRARFYNESGSIELVNELGQTVVIEINRVHPHQHNGWSGLNGNPRLNANIYFKGNEDNPIWKLEVSSGTMHYEAKTTSTELPSIINSIWLQNHLS